jgi:hypothetical protein
MFEAESGFPDRNLSQTPGRCRRSPGTNDEALTERLAGMNDQGRALFNVCAPTPAAPAQCRSRVPKAVIAITCGRVAEASTSALMSDFKPTLRQD